MIKNVLIKDELQRKTEEAALTKKCPDCRTEGRWRIEVTEGVNLVSKTRTRPGKRNFEEPLFLVFVTCLVCGYAKKETVEAAK
jgi:hypothetical protein